MVDFDSGQVRGYYGHKKIKQIVFLSDFFLQNLTTHWLSYAKKEGTYCGNLNLDTPV